MTVGKSTNKFKRMIEFLADFVMYLFRTKKEPVVEKIDPVVQVDTIKVEPEIASAKPEPAVDVTPDSRPPAEIIADIMKLAVKDIVKNLPTSKTVKPYPKRALSKIDQIVIHHSATKEGTPKGFANYHISERKWPGIGYHIVIDKKGQIFLTNYLNVVSNHVQNANSRSVGICLVGSFDLEQPTTEQIIALKYAIRYVNDMVGKILPIHKHNEFFNKLCPGKHLEALLPDIIKEIQQVS